MVIWRGWGFLVAVGTFGCLLLTEVSVETWMQDDQYYQSHGWPSLVGFWLAAVLCWVVLFAVRRFRQGGSAQAHSLFFIPVPYWPVVLIGLGVVFSLATGQ